jgi:hypothetical protein
VDPCLDLGSDPQHWDGVMGGWKGLWRRFVEEVRRLRGRVEIKGFTVDGGFRWGIEMGDWGDRLGRTFVEDGCGGGLRWGDWDGGLRGMDEEEWQRLSDNSPHGQLVPSKLVPSKLAPLNFAPLNFAPLNFAPLNFASLTSCPVEPLGQLAPWTSLPRPRTFRPAMDYRKIM